MPSNKRYMDMITKNSTQRSFQLTTPPKDMYAGQSQDFNPIKSMGVGGKLNYTGKTPEQWYEANSNPGLMDLATGKNNNAASAPAVPEVPKKGSAGLTTGDIIGITGTIAGGITQMMNSISAAKATKKNVNRFKGFNEKALATNKRMQMEIDMNQSNAERAIERKMMLESNTSKARTRGMSSSISGLKANDLATDVGVREAKIAGFNQVQDIFGQQMIGAIGQEQGLLTQQDQMVMGAQERVDDKDQMDLDNTYSNFAQNYATITQNMQSLGANLNQAKYRRDFLDILPDTNPWGIGYEYQSGINGSPTMTSRKLYNKKAATTVTETPIDPVGYNIPFMDTSGKIDFTPKYLK